MVHGVGFIKNTADACSQTGSFIRHIDHFKQLTLTCYCNTSNKFDC